MQGITSVSDLMNPEGTSWNEAKIDEMFTPDDALDIKQVAIGGPGCSNILAWNYIKSRKFSVRLAYHLRMTLNRTKIE